MSSLLRVQSSISNSFSFVGFTLPWSTLPFSFFLNNGLHYPLMQWCHYIIKIYSYSHTKLHTIYIFYKIETVQKIFFFSSLIQNFFLRKLPWHLIRTILKKFCSSHTISDPYLYFKNLFAPFCWCLLITWLKI